MSRIQLGELHGEGDILDPAAGVAAEVTVLLRDWIEALLSRARIQTADHSPRGHEIQVAIHGPEADMRKPFPYPQVHLIGAGMIPAEAEFLQNHGPLLRFSQKFLPVVIIVTIIILKYFAWFVKPIADISWKMLVLMHCFHYLFSGDIYEKITNVCYCRVGRVCRLSLRHPRYG
jgi:hypothetical protein